jgi:hypothetical protein
VEYAFCPRFTYFQLVLGIDQREGSVELSKLGALFTADMQPQTKITK